MTFTEEAIARVCHAANAELQRLSGDDAPSLPWECETEETRESAVAGVRAALAGATPEQLHEAWGQRKLRRGWVYGAVKDAEAKPPAHPCLVPYGDLPEAQRAKDRVFTAIAGALRPEAGPAADGDGYGETYWDACRAAYGKLSDMHDIPSFGELDEVAQQATEAGAQAVAARARIEADPLTVKPFAERNRLRELIDEVGVMAANAPEDGDCFAVCEEIAMRIAASGVPLDEPDDGRHPDGCDCQFCREDEREERARQDLEELDDAYVVAREDGDYDDCEPTWEAAADAAQKPLRDAVAAEAGAQEALGNPAAAGRLRQILEDT